MDNHYHHWIDASPFATVTNGTIDAIVSIGWPLLPMDHHCLFVTNG
jgi:hypothetical protein